MSRLIQVPDPGVWKPRGYQFAVWNYLQTGGKRADVVAHRRWGKDELAMAWAGHAASQRVGNYWHLFPEAAQGRKALWEQLQFALDGEPDPWFDFKEAAVDTRQFIPIAAN